MCLLSLRFFFLHTSERISIRISKRYLYSHIHSILKSQLCKFAVQLRFGKKLKVSTILNECDLELTWVFFFFLEDI